MAEWAGFNSFFANNNAGQSFLKGMEQGQAKRKLAAQKNALSQYALNPTDPAAINALAIDDPATFMAAQERQAAAQDRRATAAQNQIKANRENIIAGAKIIREHKPVDQATWTQARQSAKAIGIDVTNVPEVWNEQTMQYAAGMVKNADALEKQTQPSALLQGFQFRQGLPADQQAQFDRYQQNARPQIFGNAESGFNVFDPNAEPPPVIGAPAPPGVTFTPIQGGQSSSTTGGFLDPLAPR